MTSRAKPKPPQDEVEFFDDVEQGSDEWKRLRLGLPTSSKFSAILAEGEGKMRTAYLYQLAGEILSGEPYEGFRNSAMERGNLMEPEARDFYARTRFVDLTPVGFIRRTVRCPLGTDFVIGASPDAQVDKRKGLELKTMAPHLIIEVALRGAAGLPPQFRAQIQGTMWVADWDEMDLMIFYRGMPIAPTFTIVRDDTYIMRLRDNVERFSYDLRKLVERIKAMGCVR